MRNTHLTYLTRQKELKNATPISVTYMCGGASKGRFFAGTGDWARLILRQMSG